MFANSLFTRLRADTVNVCDDVAELLAARLELAQLEFQTSLAQVKRLAITLTFLGAVAITGLVLLLLLATELVGAQTGIHRYVWMAASGVTLVAASGAAIWVAIRHFRSDFTGLNDSLAELREDLLWIREWREKGAQAASVSTESQAPGL